MRSIRAFRIAVIAATLAALTLPAHASDPQPGLQFESTWTEEFCGNGARTADSNQCDVDATAAAHAGDVSASTHLVSPAGGTAPWTALARSTGNVVATYRLTEPVRQLDFSINMRVIDARVALGAVATGPYSAYYDYHLNRAAHVTALANASHTSCTDWCGGGSSVIVLSTWKPGTSVTTSGEDVVLSLKVTREGGKDLPPGDVIVRAGIGTTVWQTNGWGNDSASVDAVVTKISLR